MLHKKAATAMKHLFLKYNQECSFEAFPEPEIRNTREV